jgi:hypothetical protein
MLHTSPDPESEPLPPDEFDHLEDTFQRIKQKSEAWRKVLENLEEMKQKETPTNTPHTTEPPTSSK